MPFIVHVMRSWYAVLFDLVGHKPASYSASNQADICSFVTLMMLGTVSIKYNR